MPITHECQFCGKSYQVGNQYAGKLARCKQCGEASRIPSQPESDDLGLELLASKSTGPAAPLPRSVFQPAPVPIEADRPKNRKKSKPKSNSLHGSGGYNGDHLRHLVWIGIVVAFVIFRIFVRSSVRQDMREAAERRQAQGGP